MYIAGMLATWMLFAFVLPMLIGVMSPSEVFDGIRSRRRRWTDYEGEPLPNWSDRRWGSLVKKRG